MGPQLLSKTANDLMAESLDVGSLLCVGTTSTNIYQNNTTLGQFMLFPDSCIRFRKAARADRHHFAAERELALSASTYVNLVLHKPSAK
jgi:hypothetical protein